MAKADTRGPAPEVVEQAIHWMVRLRFDQDPADPATRQAFERWLALRPEHALAWRRVEGLGEDFAVLPRDLARQALDDGPRRLRRRDSLKVLTLLAGAGALGAYGLREPAAALLADYRTATGERRPVHLADGTRLLLNTDTALDVDVSGERRVLRLHQGELLVEAAAGPQPIWVQGRDGLLRAESPRFLVREQDRDTVLAVHQGTVQVFPGGQGAAAATTVGAGQRLAFDTRQARVPADDGLDPWAWRDGVLRAQAMRLDTFVAEVSRYRVGFLRCSEAVAGLRVSGIYQLKDTDAILALLARALPLRVRYRSAYWVSLEAAVA